MYLQLHDLTIELSSPDALVRAHWATMFAGWLRETAVAPAAIRLELRQQNALPPLPTTPCLFTDDQPATAVPAILTVYDGADDTVHLHFHDAGLVTVPLRSPAPDRPLAAHGVVIPDSWENGRFEDVTFTSLAPLLRRHGYFLLHAFAAALDGRAVLLVGASGSGKTTSGLRLLLDGWELLSNDVVLLQVRADGVYALAMPDMISIRPYTFQLLPELTRRLPFALNQAITVNAHSLTNGRWATPARVTAVYFPQIGAQSASATAPLSRAVCLARLLEQSVDQWDTAVFSPHLALLQTLSQQAALYTLHLGRDLNRLSDWVTG